MIRKFLSTALLLALCLSPSFAEESAPAAEPAAAVESSEPTAPAAAEAAPAPAADPKAELAALEAKLSEANKAAEADPAVQAAKSEFDSARKAFTTVRDELVTRLDPEGKVKALQERLKTATAEEKKTLAQELKTLMAPIESDPAFQAGNTTVKDAETKYKNLRNEARTTALADYNDINTQVNKLKKELNPKPAQ